MQKTDDEPHAKRRGWLRNQNPPGDPSLAPRCGAKTRAGGSCLGPSMKNGRCRLHGGMSTGPRTPGGKIKSRNARLTHGNFSREAKALKKVISAWCKFV